ncbi:uncharacterized protein [Castor canadensis]|uniref:Uncharacterized protein n=1 Tax=Castor canadensis TaxID=51338 RepID=A0AC58KH06_CASCN
MATQVSTDSRETGDRNQTPNGHGDEIITTSDPPQSAGLASIPVQGCALTAPLQCPCPAGRSQCGHCPESLMADGARRAGAAVVDQEGNKVWSSALPPGTSAQKAELIALAEALERAKGKRVNIYTDSRYAFGTIHVHGAIYREIGFRTAEGKHLKNLAKVQRLLMAVEKPKAVAVMYVPGHQSAKTPEAVGNNRADQEAKRVAMVSPPMETGQPSTVVAIDVPVPELPPLPPRPEYSTEDFTWMRTHSPFREREDGWKSDLEGKLILPEKLGRFLLANLHKSTHLGRRKLLDLLTSAQLRFPNQTIAVRQTVEDCASCTIMKPGRREGHHTG